MSDNLKKALLALAEMERAIRQTHFQYCGESWTSRGLHSPGCMLWCLYDADDAAALRGAAARLDTWGFNGPCVHAAVEAEREACVEVVERLADALDMAGGLATPKHHRLHDAAAAIRARGAR